MISQVSERTMHCVRWVLVIGWLVLIVSLFYDPISHYLTDPNNSLSPFKDLAINRASDPSQCVKVQGECLVDEPYPMGTRIFWGMVVPSCIAIVFILGHETWRRICPLYFLSQIPRALGLKPRLKIQKNLWLRKNHFYLQFALLFIGVNCRILFINSARPVFGIFLLCTILSAILVVFLYGGRSWCHYVCPFAIVQTVFTGPRGLLGSEAHKAPPRNITQSACRTIDKATGKEVPTCINCKNPCLDIDAEKSYWEHLKQPSRRLVQYGYLGLVSGYFVYYYLYSGNFDYYFSGAWTHEQNQLETIFKPGLYLFSHPINIPKLIAVPLTLALFVAISCWICAYIEKTIFSYMKRRNPDISRELVVHKVFSICTFLAFNTFYIYGGRPEIMRLPTLAQLIFNGLVVLVSALWLERTWNRSSEEYLQEAVADKLRRQIQKLSSKQGLNISQFLGGRSLEKLKPEELYVLAKVLPGVRQQNLEQMYAEVLKEALEERRFKPAESKEALDRLRQTQGISDLDHDRILTEVLGKNPEIIKLSTQEPSCPTTRVSISSLGISQFTEK